MFTGRIQGDQNARILLSKAESKFLIRHRTARDAGLISGASKCAEDGGKKPEINDTAPSNYGNERRVKGPQQHPSAMTAERSLGVKWRKRDALSGIYGASRDGAARR